ncbi:MAG: zf-HC2 domain-containing protein [Phycisphaerae bacterium]|nr:zf-HC2 domain-containing protein [Phycisphaerae bacterium]
MTEHEDIREQLSAYLDGELSEPDARRVEEALADDARLAEDLEQLRKTRRLVQSLPRERLGDDFAAKVMRAAVQRGVTAGAQPWKPAPLPNPWRRYLSVAALILFAVGLGVFVSVEMYDAGPEPARRSELAIKTPDEMDKPESFGRVARDLGELRTELAAEEEAPRRTEVPDTEGDTVRATPIVAPPPMRKGGAPAPTMSPKSEDKSVDESLFTKDATPAPVTREKSYGLAADAKMEDHAKGVALKKPAAAPGVYSKRAGPRPPYDQPVAVITGPQSQARLVKLATPEDNEIIYTDDIPASRKQVEAVLVSNSIRIAPPSQRILEPNQANLNVTSLKNKVAAKTAPPEELQYVVYGNVEQLQNVRVQLHNDVRANQNVSQQPVIAKWSQRDGQTEFTLETKSGEKTISSGKLSSVETQRKSSTPPESTTQAQTRMAEKGMLYLQRARTQPTTRTGQIAQQRENQMEQSPIHAGLIQNRAMLITLKYRQPPDKDNKADVETKKP